MTEIKTSFIFELLGRAQTQRELLLLKLAAAEREVVELRRQLAEVADAE